MMILVILATININFFGYIGVDAGKTVPYRKDFENVMHAHTVSATIAHTFDFIYFSIVIAYVCGTRWVCYKFQDYDSFSFCFARCASWDEWCYVIIDGYLWKIQSLYKHYLDFAVGLSI